MMELVAALQATSAVERWQAIANFNYDKNRQTDTETISILIKALADDHPFVRWQAGLALVRQEEGRKKLTETLKYNPSDDGYLSTVNLMRAAAIDALGKSQSPTVIPSLIEMLQADDPLLRQSAAESLANKSAAEAVPHLVEATNDTNLWVRRAAVYALGHSGNQDAAPILIACLQDRAVIVRRSAAYALGALRVQAATPHLRLSLTDKDPAIRRNAAWALGRLGSSEAIPELIKLLDDPALNGTIITTARQAIETMSKSYRLRHLLRFRRRSE